MSQSVQEVVVVTGVPFAKQVQVVANGTPDVQLIQEVSASAAPVLQVQVVATGTPGVKQVRTG